MSNSFPNMICNEPPPLDQSEEDDDDSEEIRNFSSGLKLDIDPSPMSTPRKSGGNNSSPSSSIPLPIPNGISTPDLLPNTLIESDIASNSDFDFTDSRTCCFESESMQESWIGNNSISTKPSIPPLSMNTIMKTSYIGTMDLVEDEEEIETEMVSHNSYNHVQRDISATFDADRNVNFNSNVDSDADIAPAIIDDFADFSEPITSPSLPTPAVVAATNLPNEAIHFSKVQSQLPLCGPGEASNLNAVPFTTSIVGTDDDFDDFQEFQSIVATATTTAESADDANLVSSFPAPPSTTAALVQSDSNEGDNSDLKETAEDETVSELILDCAANELELRAADGAGSDNSNSINRNNLKEIEDQLQSQPPPTPTEELNFEDAKSGGEDEERDEVKPDEVKVLIISEIQIDQDISSADAQIHKSVESADTFEDADYVSLPPETEVPLEAQLPVPVPEPLPLLETNVSEAPKMDSEAADNFDADFGDFAAFESTTPFEIPHAFPPCLEAGIGIGTDASSMTADGVDMEKSDAKQNIVNLNSLSIEKDFELNDKDFAVPETTTVSHPSQTQSQYHPNQALLANNDVPLENSSSSNFHSFSDDEDDFDDFQAFQSTSTSTAASTAVPAVPSSSASGQMSVPVPTQPASISAAITSPTAATWPSPQIPSSSTLMYSSEDTAISFPRKGSLMEDKFENLVKSLFVVRSDSTDTDQEQSDHSESKSTVSSIMSSGMNPIDKELKENDKNEEWKRVEDFEGSQGLLFKWNNSTAYQRLLHSLKIDNSTIVYSGKWGAIEVPRFAASLVDSPLLPVQESGSFKDSNSPCNPSSMSGIESPVVSKSSGGGIGVGIGSDQSTTTMTDNDCTALHPTNSGMDSTMNGVVKPLGCHISAEAEQILSQLPDLSFMRAKTLVFPNNTLQTISRDV